MTTFRYVALGADGREQSGKVQAESALRARAELTSRRLQVKSIKAKKRFNEIEMTKKKVKPQEISDLSRQLCAFLRAGIPIIDALDSIAEETKNPQMKAMLPEITAELREGGSFSDAIQAHSEHFPTYYPGIVRSAELTGRLDVILDQLATYIDRDQVTRRKVKSALTYPIILGVMAIGTVTILVGFVLPKFKDFFIGFGATLPLTTRSLLALGDFVAAKGWMVALGAFIFGAIFVTLARTERGRLTRNRIALRTPVVRGVVQAAVIERFCRILSAMIQGGIPISDGMAAAIASTDNRVYTRGLVDASEAMLEGRGFATPIAETGLFPSMVNQMIRVGEETGTLDQQLDVAATFYERELAFRLEKVTALFEPLIIVVMGGVVGFVAIALVQAMYGMYSHQGGVG